MNQKPAPIKYVITALITAALCSCHTQRIPPSACDAPSNIPDGNLLLFGETHGNQQSPKLIGDIACAMSISGPVSIGLEITSGEQTKIDAYLASKGRPADRQQLLGSDFWRFHDGRSSQAMFDLIEYTRILRSQKRDIAIFAFDEQPGTPVERSQAIANGISRYIEANQGRKIVALMGNYHARQGSASFDGVETPLSGKLLHMHNPVSILIHPQSGSTWACMPDCTAHTLRGSNTIHPAQFEKISLLPGYTYTYWLPVASVSPPATKAQAGD